MVCDTVSEENLLPDWVETAEKPPWPEETVFVDEGNTFLSKTSILRVKIDGSVYEGFPLGEDSKTSGYWPEAVWTYEGDIQLVPFERTEFLGSDVRSWSVMKEGTTYEWENVEWERIPDEIKPSEVDRSDWNSERDIFGRNIWVNENTYSVSYSDSLPNSKNLEKKTTPPWPENLTFVTSDVTVYSIGSINQLVKARSNGHTEVGFVLDTSPLRLWTKNGDIVKLSDASIKGESLATHFDKLNKFSEYDPDKHRVPCDESVDEDEYIDPQLNESVGSETESGAYVDEFSRVNTPQVRSECGDWSLNYYTPSTESAEKLMRIYRSSVESDVFTIVDDAIAGWVNDPRHANEFQAVGHAITGNTKYKPGDSDTSEIEALQSYSDFTTAYLRYLEMDTVTLYRYLDSEVADMLLDDDTVVSPRAASSWATSMGGAASTADTVWHTNSDGVILEAEIPVENILATSDTHGIFNNNEDEMIVALPEEIDLSNMKMHGHGKYNPNNS